jgi:hypothetical protein
MPGIFAILTVVVSSEACCANAFGVPIRLTPAADESVASKRRRLCLNAPPDGRRAARCSEFSVSGVDRHWTLLLGVIPNV